MFVLVYQELGVELLFKDFFQLFMVEGLVQVIVFVEKGIVISISLVKK